jgi:hypothetical protein
MAEPSHRKLGFLLAAALLAGVSVAHAGPQNDIIVRPISPAELQTLQSRQQRQNFQQRQQINRELDSLATGQRPPRIEVPVMKPRCPLQTSGTARTC